MEAENFLAGGFATRLAIESKSVGWTRLLDVARTWQPSRLKGIQVSRQFGTPFLTATQVYDSRPVPRKWLSLNRTSDYTERLVPEGTILVTCSGSVGRATLAHSTSGDILVSHDLLRVDADQDDWWGWIYAYLRAPAVREMMKVAQYGHIIKHLETQHLDQLPIVLPRGDGQLAECNGLANRVLYCRNEATRKMGQADIVFEHQFSNTDASFDEACFTRRASQSLFPSRRRFDAWRHNPENTALEQRLKKSCKSWTTLQEAGCSIWLPNRFKRIPAQDGVQLVSSSQIFEINPDYNQSISASGISDEHDGFVRPGWLMMSRSGQIYGLLGSVVLANEHHEGKIVSDDVIRVAPGASVQSGYLYVALSHALLGRPRVKALAYGSSVPHIEVEDVRDFFVPRLDTSIETEISELAESAFSLWAEADVLESRLADLAETEVRQFIQPVASLDREFNGTRQRR